MLKIFWFCLCVIAILFENGVLPLELQEKPEGWKGKDTIFRNPDHLLWQFS
jgi:hypothetical protein